MLPRNRTFDRVSSAGHREVQTSPDLPPRALPKLEVEHAGERAPVPGRKSARVEGHVAQKVRVQHADRAARRALGAEVIDVRYLDPVEHDQVLARGAAPYDEFVAPIVGCRRTVRECAWPVITETGARTAVSYPTIEMRTAWVPAGRCSSANRPSSPVAVPRPSSGTSTFAPGSGRFVVRSRTRPVSAPRAVSEVSGAVSVAPS